MESYHPFDTFLDTPDCYEALGVDPEASAAEIDWAYQEQMEEQRRSLHHIDPRIARRAELKRDEIVYAYSIVGDPARRQFYDLWHRLQRRGRRRGSVHASVGFTDAEDDISFDASAFLLAAPSGRGWLSTLLHSFPGPIGAWHFMGPFSKMLLLPIPFCLATMVAALFWHLGEITGMPVLGYLTAILAYPLILFISLLRLLMPIRYHPLLSARQRLLFTPMTLLLAFVMGWLWIVEVDHAGATTNPLDIFWWCGLLIATCLSLACF